MKGSALLNFFLPVLILLTILLFMGFDEESDGEKSEKDVVMELLEDITFNTPPRVSILFNEQFVDKKSRVRYNTLIVKTDEEYLPKSPKNPDNATNALEILKESLPEYNFGKPMSEKAHYSHLLIGNAEWTISLLHTDRGHFSKWVKKVDVHQLLNEPL